MNSKSVLIVDDSPTTSSLIRLHLIRLGYTIAGVVGSADEALQLLEQNVPDLILMDINLGEGISGIEAADIIKNRYGIPVIYVTSYSDEKTLEAAKRSMPYGFINKPIRDKDLKVSIEFALMRSSADKQQAPGIRESGRSSTEYAVLSEALDHLVSGVVMINEELQVYYCNRAAEMMLESDFPLNIRDQHLNCNNSRTKHKLVTSVRDKTSSMFTVNHESKSLHFLLFPLSSKLTDSIDALQGSVLFLFDTTHDTHRIEDVVRTLYKLSPTEAKIAAKLVFNPYLADISVSMGISHHTARTHLKRIYQKTDTKKLPALI